MYVYVFRCFRCRCHCSLLVFFHCSNQAKLSIRSTTTAATATFRSRSNSSHKLHLWMDRATGKSCIQFQLGRLLACHVGSSISLITAKIKPPLQCELSRFASYIFPCVIHLTLLSELMPTLLFNIAEIDVFGRRCILNFNRIHILRNSVLLIC